MTAELKPTLTDGHGCAIMEADHDLCGDQRYPLTNGELGTRIGVSQSMASRIRRGERLPSTRVMQQIHREFGIPLEALMAAHEQGQARFGELITRRIAEIAAQN